MVARLQVVSYINIWIYILKSIKSFLLSSYKLSLAGLTPILLTQDTVR